MLVNPTEYREFHSADEAEEWAEIHYPNLCGEQRTNNPDYERLFFYGGNRYLLYNRLLRYGGEYDCDTVAEVEQLTDILNRHILPEPVVAYRYTHKEKVKLLCRTSKLQSGRRFADKAFFSTTLVEGSLEAFGKKKRCNCILKLYLPKGLHCAYISVKNTSSVLSEQELLLQRNTEFEIIKIHRFCRPMIIECKAIINPISEV